MMSRVLGVPATNWAMVGRWFGNMAHGQFVQVAMSEAAPVKGELAIGWIAHYAIGNRLWAPAVRAVGQGLAGATDTPSSDDPRLGAAGRALFNDDAGDGNGHCGVTNTQAKRHAAEERDGPFGFRPRHVRDRTATRLILADSGVRESNTSFGGGHEGASLIRRDAVPFFSSEGLRSEA